MFKTIPGQSFLCACHSCGLRWKLIDVATACRYVSYKQRHRRLQDDTHSAHLVLLCIFRSIRKKTPECFHYLHCATSAPAGLCCAPSHRWRIPVAGTSFRSVSDRHLHCIVDHDPAMQGMRVDHAFDGFFRFNPICPLPKSQVTTEQNREFSSSDGFHRRIRLKIQTKQPNVSNRTSLHCRLMRLRCTGRLCIVDCPTLLKGVALK